MIYEILKKRQHVYEYDMNQIPDSRIIKNLLYKT